MTSGSKRKSFTLKARDHHQHPEAKRSLKAVWTKLISAEARAFPFMNLPAELQMKVLIAFYEDCDFGITVQSDLQKDYQLQITSTKIPIAPLLVCKSFYADGIRALAATHNKTAKCEFRSPYHALKWQPGQVPPFIDAVLKSISTIETERMPGLYSAKPAEGLQALRDQMPNLRRIVMMKFRGAVTGAQQVFADSPSIISVLSGDLDAAFTTQAKQDISQALTNSPSPTPPGLTLQFTRLIPTHKWRNEIETLKLPGDMLRLHLSYTTPSDTTNNTAGDFTILRKSFAKIDARTSSKYRFEKVDPNSDGASYRKAGRTLAPKFDGVEYDHVYVIPPYRGWCGNGHQAWSRELFT